jgi:hypothetical protein
MSLRFVWSPDESGHTARSDASGSGFQGQETLLGRDPKKVFMFVMKALFGEEPEKQSPAVLQDAGKTPSACLNQRRPHLECSEQETA